MATAFLVFPDHQMRMKFRRLLEGAGIELRDAISSYSALRALQSEKPDIILVHESPGDMPVENFMGEVKKLYPEQSLLVILEKPSMERALQLMYLGAFDCMEPSFSAVGFIGTVQKGLGRADKKELQIPLKTVLWWKNPRTLIVLLSGLFIVFGSWLYVRWSNSRELLMLEKQDSNSEKEYLLPYTHPSNISYDGKDFWISDWFTQSVYRHRQDADFKILSVQHFADINPVALAFAGSILWVVSANGEIQKHALDEKLTLLGTVKSPGEHPSGIAFDGNYLWTSDLKSKTIYKHLPDEKLTVLAQFPYPGDSPVGLFWSNEHLWSVDGVRKVLMRHRVEGSRLVVDEVKQFQHYRQLEFKLVGAAFDGKRFWSLTESPCMVIRHAIP